MINKRFGIIKLLGEGRSKVFLCADKFFPSQKFAIKILPSQTGAEEIKTFLDEYHLLKKFSHPNIIKAYESGAIINLDEEDTAHGIESGSLFFLLEYFDGKSLLDVDFKSNPESLFHVIGQLTSFLSYLHLAKYIYFDLKFENIICGENDENIFIKVIDYGLTRRADENLKDVKRGTSFFLAPEILLNQNVDARADLYSFGILLYHLVYGKYPFDATDELEIYHSHLDAEFHFPESSSISPVIINVLRQLLKKDPSERIQSALQLFFLLQLPVENYSLSLISATQFVGRKKELGIITEYIENKERNEIVVLQGITGSGKSFLAEKFTSDFPNVVYIDRLPFQNSGLVFQYILSKILFNSFEKGCAAEKLDEQKKAFDEDLLPDIETLTIRFSEISKAQNFILIFDDYNLLDEVVKEILLRILPILSLNGSKIILLEELTTDLSTGRIPNKIEYPVGPFLQKEIPIFLKENFAKNFPQKAVAALIKKHADLFPGNILLFIKELIAGEVLIFAEAEIFIDEEKAKKFSGVSQTAAFQKRIANLSSEENQALSILSSFDVDLTYEEAKASLNDFTGEIEKILLELQKKNMLHAQTQNGFMQFTSIGLKNFVYSQIIDKVEHHKKIAANISGLHDLSKKEISHQFELAEKYDEAYLCLKDEIQRATELSAFVYVTKTFSRLLQLSLSPNFAIEVRREFLNVLHKTGDSELALKLLHELETVYYIQADTDLLIKKGIFLIASGEVESGKKILKREVDKLTNQQEKTEILLEIISADLNTNNFGDAEKVLDQLLMMENLTREQRGKVHNLNGLLELYRNNDAEKAFASFNAALSEFTVAKLKQRIARVQVNLGNICSMRGQNKQAEEYWKSSLSINNAIGDLEQEALLRMNYGIFLFDTARYELAAESYQKAKRIFQTIGKKNGLGLSLLNSAETHLIICEYSTAIDELLQALDIFRVTENREEEASALYLLAKTFAIIGSAKDAKRYTEQYHKFISAGGLSEKHFLQLKFINTLSLYYCSSETFDQNGEEILSLCNALLETDNKHDSVLVSLIYIDTCLQKKEYQPAQNFLQNEKYVKLCSANEIYRAVHLYLLGKVAQRLRFGETSYIDYLNEAYEIIKGQSITEFTRLILSLFCEIYFERNLFIKVKEFFNLTESLIVFLSNNITDDSLRKAYLTQKERSKDLQFIRNSVSFVA